MPLPPPPVQCSRTSPSLRRPSAPACLPARWRRGGAGAGFASLGTWSPSRAYKTIHDVAPALLDPQMSRTIWRLFRKAGSRARMGPGSQRWRPWCPSNPTGGRRESAMR